MACDRVSLDPTIAEVAQSYIAAGWDVIPLYPREKRPMLGEQWPLQPRITMEEALQKFPPDCNLGVRLSDFTDADLDCSEAITLAPFFLPETKCVSGHQSAPRSHHFFVCEGAPTYLCFRDTVAGVDGKKKKLLELRCGNGMQTAIPPSVHPLGELYVWESRGELARVEASVLQSKVSMLASAVLLTRHYPTIGQRHDLALSLSGFLLRSGWILNDTVHFVTAIAQTAGDEEIEDRVKAVHDTHTQLQAGEPATGGSTLKQIIGPEAMDKITKWLGLNDRHDASVQDAWPDPLPLAPALLPVDPFQLDFLPTSLRGLVSDIAERMQTPFDFSGVTSMVGLAAVTGRRAIMRPLAFDSSWQVPLNLWAMICARPGALKSPIVNAVMQPIRAIEATWRLEHETALVAYKRVHEQEEIKREHERSEYKKEIKGSDTAELSLTEESQPPIQKRLLVSDCTFEKMHEILHGNPAGITTVRDELVSWLSELDKRGRESERGFYLQGWAGDTSFTVDRIGRGSIFVPHVCISLLGCLQPARLRAYLSDAFSDSCGPLSDGLLARFQLATWPNDPGSWEKVDREPNLPVLTTVERIFSRLAHLSAENPLHLAFDGEAQECFDAWRANLEKAISDPDTPEPLISHLAKYRSLLPRISALGTLADAAARSDFNPGPEVMPVNLSHIEQGIAFVDYAWSHAKRIYACMATKENFAAQALAKRITAGKVPAVISIRELYRHGWHHLETPEKVRAALHLLADLDWVRAVKSDREKGRPSENWQINPACRKQGTEETK
jgi:hypothetical protein